MAMIGSAPTPVVTAATTAVGQPEVHPPRGVLDTIHQARPRPQHRNSSSGRSAPPSAVARQVTPHLADASARIVGIDNGSDSDDPSQPLSSTSARSLAAATAAKQQAAARTATTDVVTQQTPVDTAATDVRSEASRVAAIERAYLQMDVKKLWHIKTMPAAEN